MKNIELPLVGGGAVSVPETVINHAIINHFLARNQELMSDPKPGNQRAETVQNLEKALQEIIEIAHLDPRKYPSSERLERIQGLAKASLSGASNVSTTA